MNYKYNANSLPFTMSSHKTITHQNNNFYSLWQIIFLSCYTFGV